MSSHASRSDASIRIPAAIGCGVEDCSSISLLDLLLVAAAYRQIVIWSTAVCTAIALVVALLLPARYTAVATLLLPAPDSSYRWITPERPAAAATPDQPRPPAELISVTANPLNIKTARLQCVALMRSRGVEDALIARYGLASVYRAHNLTDARRDLEHYSAIDADSFDSMIHIYVQDSDPRRAAAIANGFVKQYQLLVKRLALTDSERRRVFYGEQLDHARTDLAGAEEALKQTEQRTGVIMLSPQVQALVESDALLEAQLAAKAVEIHSIETYANGENAQLFQAQQELKGLREQMSRLRDSSPGASDVLVPQNKIREAELEYARELRHVEVREKTVELLGRLFEAAKLDVGRAGGPVQVVDTAEIPEKPSSPDRASIVIGAAISGLIAGMFIVFGLAYLHHLRSEPLTGSKMRYLSVLVRRKWYPNWRRGSL